jgi:hypothetical protein
VKADDAKEARSLATLEIGFAIPDTANELLDLIGAGAAEPFSLLLLNAGILFARAPIGIYRVPRAVGEVVRSEWPAAYGGPLTIDTSRMHWELRDGNGNFVADGRWIGGIVEETLVLFAMDELRCSVLLVGKLA